MVKCISEEIGFPKNLINVNKYVGLEIEKEQIVISTQVSDIVEDKYIDEYGGFKFPCTD